MRRRIVEVKKSHSTILINPRSIRGSTVAHDPFIPIGTPAKDPSIPRKLPLPSLPIPGKLCWPLNGAGNGSACTATWLLLNVAISHWLKKRRKLETGWELHGKRVAGGERGDRSEETSVICKGKGSRGWRR